MAGTYSSSMTIAGAGLLPNPPADIGPALTISGNLVVAITDYTNIGIVQQISNVRTTANSVVADTPVANASISQNTFISLLSLGSNVFPALTDTVPDTTSVGNIALSGTIVPWDNLTVFDPNNIVSFANNIYVANVKSQNQSPPDNSAYWFLAPEYYSVSGAVLTNSNEILDDSDLTKFCQIFTQAYGYLSQANSMLNSLRNANVLAETFNPSTGGMDSLTTGGLNQLSGNLTALSSDLLNLGELIYFGNLEDWGLPGEILAQIGRISGGEIPSLSDLLLANNIPRAQIDKLLNGNNDLTSTEEKAVYTVMTMVTGDTLSQVLSVLGITSSTITYMSDLLDPKKILPNSYQTLLCPTNNNTLANVYLADGAINSDLTSSLENTELQLYTGPNNTNSLTTLQLIIPSDQAIANKALARSLQQVKQVNNTTLPALARAMSIVQTNQGLSDIGNLTTPIPSSVGNIYRQQLGEGTGPNGTIILIDVIGAPSGIGITDNFVTVANVLGNLAANSAFSTLSQCYSNMANLLAGDYNDMTGNIIIPSGPGAGTYASWDDALDTGLIPNAYSEIANIVATDSDSANTAGNAWTAIIDTLELQNNNQFQAQIDFGNLDANSKSSSLSFTASLHDYGVDVQPGQANDYLTEVANLSSLSGQAVISSLREGRNIQALQDAGMSLDTQLSDR